MNNDDLMTPNTIPIDDEIFLSPYTKDDFSAVVEYLNDQDVYDNLLTVPHPYEQTHAIEWMEKNRKTETKHGRPVAWAIRNAKGLLMGGVGAKFEDLETFHRVEIGYWIGKPHWGNGFMTRAVGGFCRYLFETYTLRKITAHVLAGNEASVRVLQKNGFRQEGTLLQHFFKNGTYIDALVFGLLKKEENS